ncbi:MAG: metal-dependent hydrolase [Patescibacteria group bacterium]
MLAINHAQLAVTATLAYSIYYNQPFYLPLILFVVFSSILPDIDHPGSELGKYFKPIGKVLPHRGVTHSLVGTAIVIFVFNYVLKQNNIYTIVLVIASLFGWNMSKKIFQNHILSLDDKTKGLVSQKQTELIFGVFNFIINFLLLIILALIWKKQFAEEIFSLIVFGYVAHLVGDFLTIEGIPIFWPFKQKFGLKLFRTGGVVESFLGFVMFFVNIYLIYEYGIRYDVWRIDYWINPLTSL